MDRAISEPEDDGEDQTPLRGGPEGGALDGEELVEELEEGAEAGEAGDLEPDLDEVLETEAEEAGQEEAAQPGELADDPVRLYLKEIGRVELLGPDQELWPGG